MALAYRVALAAAITLGLNSPSGAADIAAQASQSPSLTKEERAALRPLKAAVDMGNYAVAAAALPAAQAAARSADARYFTAALQFRIGVGTNNLALQANALDAMLASGVAPASDLPALYRNQGAIALSLGKTDVAERAFNRWSELAPGDWDALMSLAKIKDRPETMRESFALMDRAIGLRGAAGQAVPESWYKKALNQAFALQLPSESIKYARALVSAYPTKENWRDALLIERDVSPPDGDMRLDLLRLLRVSRAMAGERDYSELANALSAAGFHGEAKAVLDEGVALRMVDPTKPVFKDMIAKANQRAAAEKKALAVLEKRAMTATSGSEVLKAADVLLGNGEYARAATLYRKTVENGQVDPNMARLRLGIALGLSGQRAEAETTLSSISGVRTDVASLWRLWLGQQS